MAYFYAKRHVKLAINKLQQREAQQLCLRIWNFICATSFTITSADLHLYESYYFTVICHRSQNITKLIREIKCEEHVFLGAVLEGGKFKASFRVPIKK